MGGNGREEELRVGSGSQEVGRFSIMEEFRVFARPVHVFCPSVLLFVVGSSLLGQRSHAGLSGRLGRLGVPVPSCSTREANHGPRTTEKRLFFAIDARYNRNDNPRRSRILDLQEWGV